MLVQQAVNARMAGRLFEVLGIMRILERRVEGSVDVEGQFIVIL